MIRLLAFTSLLILTLAIPSCSSSTPVNHGEKSANTDQAIQLTPHSPKIDLEQNHLSPYDVRLSVRFAGESTDAASLDANYRYQWFHNDQPVTSPASRAHIVRHPGDRRSDPFQSQIDEERWAVVVTPVDPAKDKATAETIVRFELHCDPFGRGYVVVDCNEAVTFKVNNLSNRVEPEPYTKRAHLQKIVEEHILAVEGTQAHERVVNFVDLLLKSWIEKSSIHDLPHDPDSFLYTGPITTAPAFSFYRKPSCFEIPLIGDICLNGYVYDIDNEPGFRFFDFGPLAARKQYPLRYGDEITNLTHINYGEVEIAELTNGDFEVSIQLKDSLIDVLYEPPTDPKIDNCINSAAMCAGVPYTPENDLSTYVKAHGKVWTKSSFILTFRVSVPDKFDKLTFDFRSLQVPSTDDTLTLKAGPYCTSNLGVTETPLAGSAYSPPSERPFNLLGEPLFPGLISDTSSQAQGGTDVLLSYESLLSAPYPHTESSLNGGSGVGRDRIGLRTPPYAFNHDTGQHSDNPNNCSRPADACTATGIQDGSLEFRNMTTYCQLPNLATDSDDATYSVSEQMLAIGVLSFSEASFIKGLLRSRR